MLSPRSLPADPLDLKPTGLIQSAFTLSLPPSLSLSLLWLCCIFFVFVNQRAQGREREGLETHSLLMPALGL